MMVNLLNIGCGSTFHPAWTNIDFVSVSPSVQAHDIRKGLPYPNSYFDACYSSHVLEHLTPEEAYKILAECRRVLKPQGAIRIVVPDLEAIARNYLHTLEQVEAGLIEAEPNYDWMILELYDQTSRSFRGGEMGRYLTNPELRNKDFILSRIGFEAERYWNQIETVERKSILEKIKSKNLSWFSNNLRIFLARNFVSTIAGREARLAFEEGLFRNSGEIHRWMYDRHSLRRMLERSEFARVRVCLADESDIPNFNSYGLDVSEGKPRKPDSLFMEGIKI